MLWVWIGVLALASSALGDVRTSAVAEVCPCSGDANATYVRSPNPCPTTCKNPKKKSACTKENVEYGCECNQGYVLSPSGRCILPKDCPEKCQKNAVYKKCPNPCPGTCKYPSGIEPCTSPCNEYGCECKTGYFLHNGKCITLQECPGARKCNKNETFAACNAECPDNFCPENDIRGIIACDPPYPCESGCICKANHLRLSQKNNRCVLASECPPHHCRRPNEEWNSCPSNCLADRCEDINKNETSCDKPYSYCRPQCVCEKGYYRNESDICIPAKECVKCQLNAEYKECPSPCPRTCENPNSDRLCNKSCVRHGCECKPGFVLSPEGKCIDFQECPAAKKCSKNETFVACKAGCPTNYCPVNDNRAIIACSLPYPCPPGCVCKANHLRLSRSDDRCILASECPPVNCTRPNEEWNSCPKCLAERCDDINKNQTICDKSNSYCRPQCVCKKGHYRNERDICVPVKDCVKCQSNAVYKECPNPCPRTCENPSGERLCNKSCLRHGCECESGYVLSPEGKCIKFQDCPGAKKCSKNETFVACKVGCPNNYCPKDDSRAIVICDPIRPCPPGCVCKANHLRLSRTDDKCILASECPPVKCTRPNEKWNSCPPKCLAERCQDIGKNQTDCDRPYSYCKPQCVCKDGYYKNGSDICVPARECGKCQPNALAKKCPNPCPPTCENPSGTSPCPRLCLAYGCECKPGYLLSDGKCILLKECPAAKQCTRNETFAACKVGCPSDYCPADDTRAKVACAPQNPCPPGCICKANHLRRSPNDTRCILASECPPVKCTRPNEEWNSCPPNCLAEKCEDIGKNQTTCYKPYFSCEPQCVCKKGFYRNASDICIPAIDCPGQCPIKPECRPTCAVPNPPNCLYTEPPANNIDGCQCKEGYVLSEKGGNCIKIEECPDLGCNNDPNAVVKKCPQPCPSTCDAPDATPCKKMCLPVGCECKPGYILNEDEGKCIMPNNCTGGNPCGPNGIFVPCKSDCPINYCPVDDSRAVATCEKPPSSPCYSGCVCRVNHKRKSREDKRCITSSECPPVNCTRQNEVWSSCPEACLRETCKFVDAKKQPCYTLLLNCQPRCVCAKNYFRNDSGICISANECREINANKSVDTCPIPRECRPTCAVPNPPNCNYIEPPVNNTDGCQCKSGYILSKTDGVCIKIDECPQDLGCNNDSHAVVKQCPWPCPATCASPRTIPCRKACYTGCQCSPGYILNQENGKCVLPEECPSGNPCGVNGTFSDCGFRCPNQNCPEDDSLVRYACKPGRPCPPGCLCKENYKRISSEDDTCVLAYDCPAVNCTRPNEVWNPCSQCLTEKCEDINRPVLCGDKPGTNCDPRCVCITGFYRDQNDNCIPAKKCPKQPPIDNQI